jgi:hypothetical protein
MNKKIQKLWNQHKDKQFPKELENTKINGINLKALKDSIEKCISAYVNSDKKTMSLHCYQQLEDIVVELKLIIAELGGDELLYFRRLKELCRAVLDDADSKFPARLHVLIARSGTNAIVIRRGPSKRVCTFEWDRKEDTFTLGQWFKGRIYEKRSDISANGKYWIYFAMNGKWHLKAGGSWTAIAKVPWLKALTLYAKGDGWHGGGLFSYNNKYWLNDGYGHKNLFQSSIVKRNCDYHPRHDYGGESPHVYYNRLQRDGWKLKAHKKISRWNGLTIFERQISHDWKLRKICHEQVNSPVGKGCYWDEHELQNKAGEIFSYKNWEWAEWADGVIYFAKLGKLYQQSIKNSISLNKPKLLHAFNDYQFEERQAPY